MQTAPIGYSGGMNLYAYAMNNPMMFIDPFGLCAEGGGLQQTLLNIAQGQADSFFSNFAEVSKMGDPSGGLISEYITIPLTEKVFYGLISTINKPFGEPDKKSHSYNIGYYSTSAAIFIASMQAGGGSGLGDDVAKVAKWNPKRALHIFRNAEGHVNPATQASQQRFIRLFQKIASNPANKNMNVVSPGAAKGGITGFSQTSRNGSQVWVHIRNNEIINAGINVLGGIR